MKTFGYLAAQSMSWLFTGAALFNMIRSEVGVFASNPVEAFWVGIAIALLLTTFIQGSLTYAWTQFFGDRRGNLVALIPALALSLFSGGLGGASLSAAFSASQVVAHKRNAATVSATSPLWEMSANMSALAVNAEALAARARTISELEAAEGGTCQGDLKQKSCGPKCRLRARQSTALTRISEEVRALSDQASDLATKIAGSADDETARRLHGQAMKLASSVGRSAVGAEIGEMIRGFRSGWVDPDTNKRFECRDPRFEPRLQDFADQLAAKISLPATAPVGLQVTFLDMMDVSLAKLQRMIGSIFTDERRLDTLDAVSDWGIWVGLFIDSLIVWMISAAVRERRERVEILSRADNFFCGSKTHVDGRLDKIVNQVQLLLELTYISGGQRYFAVPVDGSPEAFAKADALALMLELQPDSVLTDPVDLGALDPGWVASRSEQTVGGSQFLLYRIPKRIHAWCRGTVRDAMFR